MQYLTNDDLKIVVDEDTLEVIHQNDDTTLDKAEAVALEEISGFLRSRFNMVAEFSQIGEQRNQQILMYCADIMLYHLISWMPKRLGWEIREIRYNNAIEWLTDVQNGKITPNLPPYQDEDGTTDTSHYRMQYGSIPHQTNVY